MMYFVARNTKIAFFSKSVKISAVARHFSNIGGNAGLKLAETNIIGIPARYSAIKGGYLVLSSEDWYVSNIYQPFPLGFNFNMPLLGQKRSKNVEILSKKWWYKNGL